MDEVLADVLALEDSEVEDLVFGPTVRDKNFLLPNFGFTVLAPPERPVARAFAALAASMNVLPDGAERTQSLLRLVDALQFALSALRRAQE
jgi:hypothetical protein